VIKGVTVLNKQYPIEASHMKRPLFSIITASVVMVAAFASTRSVCASDTPNSDQNTVEKEATAQNASAKEGKGTSTAKVNLDSKGVILRGYDAVAYFKQGKPVKGDPAIASNYDGATYLFASSADKAEFDKSPAKYVPRYGAFCSYGVANGVLADLDGPDAFAIYKGKLYLCGNEGALKGFKSDIDSNIQKADTYWQHLTGH
jgi:YHS domain-containing protein